VTRRDWEDESPYYRRPSSGLVEKVMVSGEYARNERDMNARNAIREALKKFELAREMLTSTSKLLILSQAEVLLKEALK
jgi:hypothetical protein